MLWDGGLIELSLDSCVASVEQALLVLLVHMLSFTFVVLDHIAGLSCASLQYEERRRLITGSFSGLVVGIFTTVHILIFDSSNWCHGMNLSKDFWQK